MLDSPPCRDPDPETLRSLVADGPSPVAAARLFPGFVIAELSVERVHFPAGRPVQLQIRATGGDGQSRVLIGEWLGHVATDHAGVEAARLAKPRRGQGASPGSPAITADPARGLVLRRPGHDARLPGLRLLHDRDAAALHLARLGCDPGATVTLVAHRLGKRAVLRVDGPDGTRYARLRPVTSTSGRAAFDQHQALWQALQGSDDLAIPRPRAFDAELGLALYDTLPGAPPVFRGLPGYSATQAVMRALAALQALPVKAALHGAADEMAILDLWADRTGRVFLDLAAALSDPLQRLRHRMAALSPRAPVPCHRDLHEGQILLAEGRAGLLDFDTLRLSDPVLDVGNLQAHLLLASLREGAPRRAFVTAMDNALPQVPLPRIALWRAAALLRLAMIYAFSTAPRPVLHGLIQEADRCLAT